MKKKNKIKLLNVLHHNVDEIVEAFEMFGLNVHTFDTGCGDRHGGYVSIVISEEVISEKDAEDFASDE